jgi:hypothetical protein
MGFGRPLERGKLKSEDLWGEKGRKCKRQEQLEKRRKESEDENAQANEKTKAAAENRDELKTRLRFARPATSKCHSWPRSASNSSFSLPCSRESESGRLSIHP